MGLTPWRRYCSFPKMPLSMRSLLCCKCGADQAVVEGKPPTAEHHQPAPLSLTRRDSAFSSLAYFDAVEEEDDITVVPEARNETERFFDTEESSHLQKSSRSTKEEEDRTVVTEGPTVSSQEMSDESLLGSSYRTKAGGRRRRRLIAQPGFPGSLTPSQLTAYQQFRSQLEERGGIYKEMVYNYSDLEPEPYALCRYLRFCNFNVGKCFAYMDKHVERWNEAKKHDFYPDVSAAVGAPLSVLLTQFPSLYLGFAREGYPCCYFNSGTLSVEGMECVTDLDLVPNFIWYTMMHDMKRKFREVQENDPSFVRLEQLTIMNLEGMSRSLFTPHVYSTLQKIDMVANVFPEMLHTLVIINAPGFFTFMWSIISKFLDKHTTDLIEMYSSKDKGQKRLLELIDESELPRDYGGQGIPTSEAILKEGRVGPIPRRQIVELLNVRPNKPISCDFALTPDENVKISIYSRSTGRVVFSLLSDESNVPIVDRQLEVPLARIGSSYCFEFAEVTGPGIFTVLAKPEDMSSKEYFLIVGEVFTKTDT